jgi:SAM-dependent methyltransferase
MSSQMWDERYSASELVWSSTPNEQVAKFAATLSPGRALDFAGGEGRNALWLVENGWDATVLDFSQVALERSQELASARFSPPQLERFHTVLADAANDGVPPHSFDLVVVAYLQLAHDQRRVAMQTAAGAVRAGGQLFVIAHDSANLEHGYGGPQNPAVLYTAAEVTEDLRESGLQIVRAEAIERVVTVEAAQRTAIDALVIAQRPSVG